MSVKVSVGADVDPAVNALKKIDSASRDAARGNKELADAIAQVNQQLEEAKKISPGFRESLKNTGQLNKSINEIDWKKLSTNPRVAANQRSKIVNYATAGTQFEPPGSPYNSGGGGKGGLSMLPIPGMMKGILALAGIGGLASMASKSAALGQANTTNVENLLRASDSLAEKFNNVDKEIAAIGVGFGVASVEAGRLAKMFSSLSGETKTAIVAENTRNALALSKGFGIDNSTGVRSMAKMQWMMGGKMQQKELGLIIADGIVSGGMFAKGDEVMGAIERFVESSERVLVNPPDVGAYAALKALMDNNKSAPGLRGRGGESALNTINQGIQNPGGGEAGDYFLYRAIGQGLGVGQYEYLKEAGMLGSLKNQDLGDDPTFSIVKVMRRLKMEMSDPFMRAMGMKNTLGLSMHQGMEFEKIFDEFKPDETSKFLGLAKKADIDLTKVNSGVYGDLGKIANTKGVSEDSLIDMMKHIADLNITETPGSTMLNAVAELETELTKIGTSLLTPLNFIKENTANLLSAFRYVHEEELSYVNQIDKYLGLNNNKLIDERVINPVSGQSEKKPVIVIEGEILLKDQEGNVISRYKPYVKNGEANAQ